MTPVIATDPLRPPLASMKSLASTPETIAVSPADDLARKVAALAPGSTVTLRAGRYVLRQPLVLLAGITLKGAGRGRTTISSRVAGSLVLVCQLE